MLKFCFIPVLVLLGMMMNNAPAEHVFLSGGPALMAQEGYRIAPERHDRWWANFVRAATLRMELLRKEGSMEGFTWIVYKKGYVLRGREDGKPYTQYITDLAKKHKATLVWIDSAEQAFNTINRFAKGSNKISTFDYFGHSNASAFMLDYSCDILGVSSVWIHESELNRIRSDAFAPDAQCFSYGCYTATSMSYEWKHRLGIPLYASTGKTDYSELSFGRMPKPSSGGSWNH